MTNPRSTVVDDFDVPAGLAAEYYRVQEKASKPRGEQADDTTVNLDTYRHGDGTIASARTHGEVAALVLDHKDEADAKCRHGVYTLVCRNRYGNPNEAFSAAARVTSDDTLSSRCYHQVCEAGNAPLVMYVGQSQDVVHRLHSHVMGRATFFTELFPPTRIKSIDWYKTEREAREAEQERAAELESQHPRAYIGGGR